ncbi:hypothetical protein O181_032219 [Austropuccinia psidii MF-1]|uniref:Reverse transcriptase domain-containing protein n=1 Tax=Austropuccinia psidii MF-1 TaxID=1389203 RepID=A0A9Q3H7B8_9BASI|nr:hypothetical protein [Austropuccinia psidii MF-1]
MWKRALTSILRKSGKDNYSDPGEYCPITLLSTLGKLFKKIINDTLSFWAEHTGFLATGHMGGRPGRSIYDAFIILTSWIKAQWCKGKIVMGLFLDVSSAYPSVVSDCLVHTLTVKNCPPYLISIIKSFLNICSTIMKLDYYLSDPIDIVRGLAQGSPLVVTLCLLYNSALLVDNLLTLEDQEILLGFVDDVAHLVSDSSYNSSLKRLHVQGNLSLNWGLKHGSVFDKKKAKVIVFSHKKIATQETFLFGDQELKFDNKVKWVGLMLDQKLTFKKQIAKTKAMFLSLYNQLAIIIKVTYGIDNQEAKQLVLTVIQSRVLYGSLVWFTKRNEKSVSSLLETAHKRCVRLTTGFLKQTPIAFLKHDGVLKLLLDAHTRLLHNYIYRAWTLPPNHPVKNIVKKEITDAKQTHSSSISLVTRKEELSNLLNTNPIEMIYPKPMAPWLTILDPPHNIALTREDAKKQVRSQILKETARNSIVIFTDGSSIPGQGVGAATLISNTTRNKTRFIRTTESVSNFEAELMGIQLANGLDTRRDDNKYKNNLSCYL